MSVSQSHLAGSQDSHHRLENCPQSLFVPLSQLAWQKTGRGGTRFCSACVCTSLGLSWHLFIIEAQVRSGMRIIDRGGEGWIPDTYTCPQCTLTGKKTRMQMKKRRDGQRKWKHRSWQRDAVNGEEDERKRGKTNRRKSFFMVIFHTEYACLWNSGVHGSCDLWVLAFYIRRAMLFLNEFLCKMVLGAAEIFICVGLCRVQKFLKNRGAD